MSSFVRRLVGLGALASLALFPSEFAGTQPAPAFAAARELHLALLESPKSLDPLLSGTAEDNSIAALVFDFLLEERPDGTRAPSLALQEPTLANGGISRDGKHVVFHLRGGVKWQDGKPFTSADVAFTVRTILDPKLPIATRTGYDDIASVTTPDPLTVSFQLKHAYAPFVEVVSTQYPIVPAHLLEHSPNVAQDPFGANPVGTGPYRFVRQARGDRIEYEANPLYWGSKPKIERVAVLEIPDVTTMALEVRTGQLDFMIAESSQFAQLRKDPRLVSGILPIDDFVAFALNTTRAPLDDVRVRRAISAAVDRARIVRDVTFGTGTPAYADLPAFLWQSPEPPNPYSYDPAKARALLDAAGWHAGSSGTRSKNGQPLHLVAIDFSGSVSGRTIDAELQSMLAAVGIDVELKYFSPTVYYNPGADGGPFASGNFDLAAESFGSSPDPDDSSIYTCANREPNGYNAARYCSPQMDALQRASLGELDPGKRRSIVVRIQELAVRDAPYVFLYHTPYRYVHARSLQHATPGTTNEFYRVENWSFSP